jgi:uncharacterized protein (DUF58 family)
MYILTNRFRVLLGIIFGLIILGMATLRGELIILAVPFIVYLSTAILFSPNSSNFMASRRLSHPHTTIGIPVDMEITIKNNGNRIDEVQIEDRFSTQLICVDGEYKKLLPFAQSAETTFSYSLRSPRGHHTFTGISILVREHFDLIEQSIFLPVSDEVRALPSPPTLKQVKIRPRQTRGYFGPIQAHRAGSGMTFWGVRDYQMGDSLRRINWKISSRHEQAYYTNEYEQDKIADIGLILDARQKTNFSTQTESIFDYSVMATAGLANSFLSEGHRVSLLAYGFYLQRVYPGYGKIQRERIIHALTRIKPGSNFALENFNYLPIRLFPPKSQLIVISPLSPGDIHAFTHLLKEGYSLMLVTPDPVDFEKNMYRPSQSLDQAIRISELERKIFLGKLSRLGVQVINWPVSQPLNLVIQAAQRRRPLFLRSMKVNR